jgi:hypothetical protein
MWNHNEVLKLDTIYCDFLLAHGIKERESRAFVIIVSTRIEAEVDAWLNRRIWQRWLPASPVKVILREHIFRGFPVPVSGSFVSQSVSPNEVSFIHYACERDLIMGLKIVVYTYHCQQAIYLLIATSAHHPQSWSSSCSWIHRQF